MDEHAVRERHPAELDLLLGHLEEPSLSPSAENVLTKCSDVPETAIVSGQPKVVTQVSTQQAAPGTTITDKVLSPVSASSRPR